MPDHDAFIRRGGEAHDKVTAGVFTLQAKDLHMRICGVEIDAATTADMRRGRVADILSRPIGSDADRFARGLALSSVGRVAEARREFELCRGSFPIPCRTETAFLDVVSRQRVEEATEELRLLATCPCDDETIAARRDHVLGLGEGKLRRTAEAVDALLRSLKTYEAIEDRRGAAQVRDTLGTVEAARGRLDSALQYFSLSLVDKTLLDDRLGMALTLGNLGRIFLRSGRLEAAVACFERDRLLCRETGDVRGECRMYDDLGRTHLDRGELEAAERELLAGIAHAREHRFSDTEFFCRKDLARLRIVQQRWDEAETMLREAAESLPVGGESYLRLVLSAVDCELRAALGDRSAPELLEKVVQGFHDAELPDFEIPARILLAEVYLRERRAAEAEENLLTAIDTARTDGYTRYLKQLNGAMLRLGLVETAVDESKRRVVDANSSAADADFLIREELGRGGFGVVYRIYDAQRGGELALKRLALSRLFDVRARERLLRSARIELEAASRIHHPGIVRVLAVRMEPNGDLDVIQQFVPGGPLTARLPLDAGAPLANVLAVLTKIAYALDALHDAGVVHRDLKPANILMRSDDTPVIIDFGIAVLKQRWSRDYPDTDLAGSFDYAAPEQLLGKDVDHRADLYSFGVVAYRWLAGTLPLHPRGASWDDKARDVATRLPAPLTDYRPNVPAALSGLISRLLEKKPRRRPVSAADVGAELRRITFHDA